MKFYSKIVNKPHSIIEEVKNGQRVIKRNRICIFFNGVLETEDSKVIAKLESRKDLFRSDRPWKAKESWRTTEEGKKLLKRGEILGIKCRHIKEWYLKELIAEKTGEKLTNATITEKEVIVEKKEEPKKVDYKEIMKLAKEKGIKTHKIKKEVLVKALTKKGVNINA